MGIADGGGLAGVLGAAAALAGVLGVELAAAFAAGALGVAVGAAFDDVFETAGALLAEAAVGLAVGGGLAVTGVLPEGLTSPGVMVKVLAFLDTVPTLGVPGSASSAVDKAASPTVALVSTGWTGGLAVGSSFKVARELDLETEAGGVG